MKNKYCISTSKKILSLFFIITILFTFTACGGEKELADKGTDNTTTGKNPDETVQETKEPEPDITKVDMNQKEFKIFCVNWGDYDPFSITDIVSEGITGEVINDAAYNRQLDIENELNCKITQLVEKDWNNSANMIKKSVSAQDNAYDICIIRAANLTTLITSNSLYKLEELPNNDFSQPWWDQNSYDSIKIAGHHYGVCGGISSNYMMAVWTVCFNKQMVKDFSLESPYKLVTDGKWTMAKATEMSKVAAMDLNSDGIMDQDDRWGINYTYDTTIGVLNGCGVKIADFDSDGNIILKVNEPSNIEKIQNTLNLLYDNTCNVDTLGKFALEGQDGKFFADNRCLFMFTASHSVNALRQMDVDFGIIPYPKYDEAQPEYMPGIGGIFLAATVIPSSNTDIENTSIFLENFAYEGSKTIIPAFYDNILKSKLTRDDESAEMLDFIYGNIMYDVGNVFNIGTMPQLFSDLTRKQDTNIASFMEKNVSKVQTALDKLVESVNK